MHQKRLDHLARLTRGAAVLSAAFSLVGGSGAACANTGSTVNAPPGDPSATPTGPTVNAPPQPLPSLTPPPDPQASAPAPAPSGSTGRPHFVPINAPPRPFLPPASSTSQP
jgi:hypothetical protein